MATEPLPTAAWHEQLRALASECEICGTSEAGRMAKRAWLLLLMAPLATRQLFTELPEEPELDALIDEGHHAEAADRVVGTWLPLSLLRTYEGREHRAAIVLKDLAGRCIAASQPAAMIGALCRFLLSAEPGLPLDVRQGQTAVH